MRILIACEESQTVCIEMRKQGHEAFSCDTEPCSGGHPEWHIQDNVLNHLDDGWDMMIAHPPCTYLSRAAGIVLYNKDRLKKTKLAFDFVLKLWNANIDKICIENPPGWLSTNWRQWDQKIHPYYFGDCEMKETCFWLKNLKPLQYQMEDDLFGKRTATDYPKPMSSRMGSDGKIKNKYFVSRMNTAKERSKTFQAVAKAMADQWG